MNNMTAVNHLSTLNSTSSASRKNASQFTEDEALFSQLLQASEFDSAITQDNSDLPPFIDDNFIIDYQEDSSLIIMAETTESSQNLDLIAVESVQEDRDDLMPLAILAATGFVMDAELIEEQQLQYKLSPSDSEQTDEDSPAQLDNIKSLRVENNNSSDKKRDLAEHLAFDEIDSSETERDSHITLKTTRNSSTIPIDNTGSSLFQNAQSTNNTVESNMNMFSQQTSINASTPQAQAFTPASPSVVSLPVAISNPQWQESFNQQISLFSRHDIQKAEIRLNPEELGSLHIKLEMNDGKMHLQVIAAQSLVKGIVELAVPNLRVSLAEQGIDLQDVDVSDSVMSNNTEQHSMFEQRKNPQHETGVSASLEKDIDAESQVSNTVQVRSGLSIFA